MNEPLARFFHDAQLDVVLAFLAAMARVFLAFRGEPQYECGLVKKALIIVGSIALGVVTGFIVRQVPTVATWGAVGALAAAYLGQDMTMRLTRRANDALDAGERVITRKLSPLTESLPKDQKNEPDRM